MTQATLEAFHRSLLFVPGDRPERFGKAARSGADAIIIDLEDAVAPTAKQRAREAVRAELDTPAPVARFVRINPAETGILDLDIAAARGADGIVLPKAEGAATVRMLVRAWGADCPPILPIATETPAAMFQLGAYAEVAARLHGITWGAEDLPAAIGAQSSREPDGRYCSPYELARSLTLFGACAAGVAPIETVYPSIKDIDGLRAYAVRGARDGFTGMLALHPAQIDVINAAFSPSDEDVARARAIVDAFDAMPGAGVLTVEGRMVDAPHLAGARRILNRAGTAR